jgi:cytochrome c oxidase assembly protein subunit 11
MNNRSASGRTALMLVGIVLSMGVLSFVAVPAYTWFSRVTGYGGTPNTDVAQNVEVLEQTVIIRFDASLERDMPWKFRPVARQMELRIGEVGLAFYEAYNPTDRVVAGTASYNVAPHSSGSFFTKVDCFCYTVQVLQPGETVQLPVSFYVDPKFLQGREAKGVQTITLSYTFYETELPETEASLAPSVRPDQDIKNAQVQINRGTPDGT